jgi:anti-sigma factor RsiW
MSIEQETGAGMDCRELERSLEPYLDGELEARELAEVDAHLACCAPCRDLLEARSRARSLVRARLREAMGPGGEAGRAPEALRARISEALARERRPWRRALSPVPLAALAACAAGALVVLASHSASDPLVEEAVRKHARDLPLEVSADAVAADAIPGMLASKLDFYPRPPRFQAPGLSLVGARLSTISDRPAAYMRYQTPRGRMGLFIIDDPGGRVGKAGRAVEVGPATVRVMNSRGYNVAVWRQHEIVYSLVTDLDEGDLVRLVGTAQSAAAR